MATWTQAVVGTRAETHDLNRLIGKLSDGIIFVNLTDEKLSELEGKLELDTEKRSRYRVLLLIREDLYEGTNRKKWNSNYFMLCKQVSVYIRIALDPEAFIAKTSNPKLTEFDADIATKRNNIYSHRWSSFLVAYEEHKTTFDLFSAATVTDRTDVIFNVLNSVVSLESLLLNGESAENSYKFRLRGAFVLSRESGARKLIYTFLKYAYELRSSIVHSNDKLRRKTRDKMKTEYGLNLYEVNSELIKMNRFILKQLIDNPSFLDNFDDLILSGEYSFDEYKSSFIFNRIKARAATVRGLAKKAHISRQ